MKAKVLYILTVSLLSLSFANAQLARYRFEGNINPDGGLVGTIGINGTQSYNYIFAKEGTQSISLSGTYIWHNNPGYPIGNSARTITAWARTSSTLGPNAVNYIFSFGTNPPIQVGPPTGAFVVGVKGTSVIGGSSVPPNATITSAGLFTPNVWHHVAVTHDGTTTKVYVDGTEALSVARTWTTVAGYAYIGANPSGNASWNGLIDDVKVYNTALPATDIQAMAVSPPAPTNIVGTFPSSTTMNLSWSESATNETGFNIIRTSPAPTAVIATVPPNTTNYLITTGITPNTYCEYFIVTAMGSVNSSTTYEGSFVGLYPLRMPAGLTAIAPSSTQVSLSWTDVEFRHSGYDIERSTTPGSGFTVIGSTAANVKTFTDTPALNATAYYYRVRSKNSFSFSSYTSEVMAMLPALPTDESLANANPALKYKAGLFNTYVYKFDMSGVTVSNPSWNVVNGTVTQSGVSGSIYYAYVNWTTTGTGTVSFNNTDSPRSMNVTVYDPDAPLSISTYPTQFSCGNSTVNRVQEPESYESWYWQRSSDTQTDLGLASFVNLTSTSTLYIRRKWNIWPYPWGTRQSLGNIPVDALPSAPTTPTSSGGLTLCGNDSTILTTTHPNAAGFTWIVDGFDTIQTTIPTLTVFPILPVTNVIVRAFNSCGESAGASIVITAPLVSSAGGITKSVNSGTNISRTCSSSFGNTTVENFVGTVLRWEYSTTSADGPWTNWGQAGQTTTSSGLPAVTKVWVRAIMNTACGSFATTTTSYIKDVNKNYSRTYVPQSSYFDEETVITTAQSPSDVLSMTTFFDGLGRGIQNVGRFASPLQNDVVTFQEFDKFGRPTAKYLPYADAPTSECETYKYDYKIKQQQFYSTTSPYPEIPSSTKPFAITKYESSPVNRVLKQGATGETWQPSTDDYSTNDNTIKLRNEWNIGGDVLTWTYDYTSGLISAKDATGTLQYYPAGSLLLKKTISEDNKVFIQYIDQEGRTVLTRRQAINDSPVDNTYYAATYYVYDDFSFLRAVISPEATKRLNNEYHNVTSVNQEAFLSNWAFRYNYDDKHRLVQKKVPGADWLYVVYDNLDRPVMTQDGNQRVNRQWQYIKYDDAHRPIIAGIYTHATVVDQPGMSSLISTTSFNEKYNGDGLTNGYTNTVFPTTNGSVITVLYYDNYDYRSLQGSVNASRFDFNSAHLPGQLTSYSLNVKTQITGVYSAVLDQAIMGGSTQTGLWTTRYYDFNYQPIQVISENYKGGTDVNTAIYNFSGQPTKMLTTHMDGIVWKDLANSAVYGNRISKTVNDTNWNSGMGATNILASGTDGWFEFKAVTGSELKIGFGVTNPDANWTSLRYAISLSGTTISYIENGVITSLLTATYSSTDVLRIGRIGSNVKIYKNGVELLSRPMVAGSYIIDVSMGTNLTAARGFKTSFGNKTSLLRELEYDNVGRLKNIWNTAGSGARTLTTRSKYNEIGSLSSSSLHSVNGTDFNQVTDYRYNIRGWLLRINNSDVANNADAGPQDYFGEELSYDQSIGISGQVTQNVNGNISAVKWSRNIGLEGNGESAYAFKYDKLNRLTDADYQEKTTAWAPSTAYSENGISYDLNGNIKALSRKGKNGTPLDNLIYSYGATESNRLMSVSDSEDDVAGFIETTNSTLPDFAHDMNGNVVLDQNRGSKEFVVNSSFDNGTTGWTLSGTTSRLTVSAGAANITASPGTGSVSLKQSGIIDSNKTHVVVLDLQRTSSTGAINVNVGGIANDYTTGILTFSVLAGSTNKDITIVIPDTWGGKINLVSVSGVSAMAYNELNKLMSVAITGDGTIATVYDGNGNKLLQEVYSAQNEVLKRRDYDGPFLYEDGTLSFIQHESGRIVPGTDVSPDWEYQYIIPDHLGNVRVMFTTKENEQDDKATLETANATSESSNFLYYDEAVKINSQIFDHTKQGATNYSTRLSGSANEKFGLAKSLSVMPGDVVSVKVFAKYLDPESSNWTPAMTALMSSIAGGTAPAGTFIDGGLPGSTGGATVPYTSLLNKAGETGTAPKAYLNWVFFDRDYNFIDGGYERVDESAKENGSNVQHQTLSRQIDITKPGYVYVYLSNENATPVEVYFDDFTIEHVMSPIIQLNDYYPFGSVSSSWSREDAVPNSFLFNGGSELNDKTLWYETYFREYDPSIGRFMQIDPKADYFSTFSPYIFSRSNPIKWNDPFGAEDGDGNPGFSDEVWGAIVAMWMITPDGSATQGAYIPGSGWAISQVTSSEYSQGVLYLTTGGFFRNDGRPVEVNGASGLFYFSEISMPLLEAIYPSQVSSEISFSNLANGVGLVLEGGRFNWKMEANWAPRYQTRMQQLREIGGYRSTLKTVGKVVGGLGIAATAIEAAWDRKLTLGDGVKVAIATASLFCPVFGVVYAVADITVQFSTGTSITDRVASAVDTSTGNFGVSW